MPSSFASCPKPPARPADPSRALPSLPLVSLLCVPAFAAESPLSFAEALRLAVERSPQLESQRAMVDAAREMTGPAGELPDPKLKLGVENVPTNGADSWSLTRDFMTMTKIGVMQEFPREEKRKLRSQRAENDAPTQRRRAGVDAARGHARGCDRVARALVCGRDGTPDRTPDRRGCARGYDCRSGVSGGEGAAGRSPHRAELADRAAQPRDGRGGPIETCPHRAGAIRRRRGGPSARPSADLSRLPFDTAQLADVDAQPEVRAALAREASAATEVDLARAAKTPDWSAELTYAVRGSPIPTWCR
jgi:hypothetical protein